MEQQDYDDLMDMFASNGWRTFISSAADLEESLTQGAVDSAVTNETWQYLRGQLGQLRSILGYEAFIETSWQAIQEQAQEEANFEASVIDVDSI